MRTLSLLTLLVACSCTVPPDRPTSVPADAVWAGGSDGGAWIDCGMSTKEPLTTFWCSVFHENGDVWVERGSFALVERTPAGYELIEGPFHSAHPIRFDGEVIDLRGSRLLIPEEWVQRVGYDVKSWRVVRPSSASQRTTLQRMAAAAEATIKMSRAKKLV